MKISDYFIRPENLPRIKGLGFLRFVIFYGVIPTFLILTIWIPAHKWITTRGTIFADVFDILAVLELARNVALLAPVAGFLLGTLMWCAIVGADPMKIQARFSSQPRRKTRAIALVLAGVIGGAGIWVGLGAWIHREMMSPWEDSQIAYASAWYDYISAREFYLNGDYETAHDALHGHIDVLSRIADKNLAYTGFLAPQIEIAYTYTRLSLLEQVNDNPAEAQRYWNQAASLLKSAGWKEIDRRKILRTLKGIDGALPDGISIPEQGEDP